MPMNVPPELRYSETHEWTRLEADGTVSVGITWHAQDRLGDLVFVEVAPVGKSFAKGPACAGGESVKAGSGMRSGGIGQGGVGHLRAGVRYDRGNQFRSRRQSREGQPGRLRELDVPHAAERREAIRIAAERR